MEENGKKVLEHLVAKEITKLFESVLDYTSIAVSDEKTFRILRGKILGVGNDCIRKICSELIHYDIKYVEKNEDFIEIRNK